MTFQFSYKHILNLKEKEKDQAFSEFGLSLRKKEGILIELHSLVQKREECLTRWSKNNQITYISEIQQKNDYLEFINQEIAQVEQRICEIEVEISAKKEALLSKQKDEKMWHHLRDKSYDEYLQKQKKIEQDLLDEMATIRHYHQRVGNTVG